MPSVHSKLRPLALIFALIWGLLFCLAAPAAASSSPQHSPQAASDESELICHTSNPEECYPRVFVPTHEFQTVHDDQQLPNGLHVRLNIWTGQKEAKINVPDEVNPDLGGLPVDQAVVLVDQEQPETIQIPKGAPKYDNVGKIKEPAQEGDAQTEAIAFAETFNMLKTGESPSDEEFDNGLEGLEELSHDIYYGLKITEDADVVKALFCLMGARDGDVSEGATPRDQQAAAILAGALSNNPSALAEIAKIWPELLDSSCPRDGAPISDHFYQDTVSVADSPAKVKAAVSAINGLIKDDDIRKRFLENSGMKQLLSVLCQDKPEWAGAQRKVAQLVLDTFLDEDMGAQLGQWPKGKASNNGVCAAPETALDDGCWDYHADRMVKLHGTPWSKELKQRLGDARKANSKSPDHGEL
ncbi:Nucleotide exchange factor SIL1 [Trichoderma ghanense]|uniref:Nucleotide exchange factor SIL1 n=1 Tax=Trichoderma ghanense TaxID=65468 RepID=A0ABY2H945_9HYPO